MNAVRPEAIERLTVAAVMAVYNQSSTIVEAVESILAQTRQPDEIILVDDGSTDGSGDIIRARYGDRVRVIRQENRGAPAARNVGVRAARSDLVGFIDADDKWLPNHLEKQTALMAVSPSCMLSFTGAVCHDEVSGITRVEGTEIHKATYLTHAFFREEILPATDAVMVRREVFREVGWFDEATLITFDTDMWLRIMVRYGFEHIPEPLVWVRRGPHQTLAADLGRIFCWHDRYFAKHRYTFGRGLRGQMIWRAGYGAVLRGHAIWYLRHGQGRLAVYELLRAVSVWPLFNPKWVLKAAAEHLLGPRVYGRWVEGLKTLLGGKKRFRPDATAGQQNAGPAHGGAEAAVSASERARVQGAGAAGQAEESNV